MKVVLLGWTTSPRLGSDSDRETDRTTLKRATVILKTSSFFFTAQHYRNKLLSNYMAYLNKDEVAFLSTTLMRESI